jgi:hypothetical protein
MKKLRADWIQGMPAPSRFRIFCRPIYYLNIWRSNFYLYKLPVFLYGCEIWSHNWLEEHKLNKFWERLLRRIFGPKGEEATGGRRQLHNELCNLCLIVIRMIKSRSDMGRTCNTWSGNKVRGKSATYLIAEYHCGRLQSTTLGKLCTVAST